ncbi:MAG: chromate transporter [Clostridia bacterium]|nr:chromate transporter [Clostridia bacterium]
MKKSRLLLNLFWTMLKIGLFTFGGGYAMIALMEKELVDRKEWIGKDEFLDMIAIAESTPGPVAINSATYIGFRMAGVLGSAVSTLGVVLPSFVIVFVISLFFEAFLSLTVVAYAFKGIQICVVYLILSAGVRLMKGLKLNVLNVTLAAVVFTVSVLSAILVWSFSSVWLILASALVGILVYALSPKKEETS